MPGEDISGDRSSLHRDMRFRSQLERSSGTVLNAKANLLSPRAVYPPATGSVFTVFRSSGARSRLG